MERLSRIGKFLADTVSALTAKRGCLGCGDLLTNCEVVLCQDCLNRLNYIDFDTIDILHIANIKRQRQYDFSFTHIFPFIEYMHDSIESKFIVNIKNHSSLDQRILAGILLGNKIKDYCNAKGVKLDADMIIPAPIIKSREQARGYCQTSDIALGLGHSLGVPVHCNAVINSGKELKLRAFLYQATDKDKFRVNKYQMVCAPDELKGKHILLFDDQITSGDTVCSISDLIYQKTMGDVRISLACLSISKTSLR